MERKKILGSQRELLFVKRANVQQAQMNLQNTLTSIALEVGIPESEIDQWQLNNKAEYFEKVEPPKKNPEKKIPKKR